MTETQPTLETLKTNQSSQQEVLTSKPQKEINLPGGITISFEQVRNGKWIPNKEKPGKVTYVVTTGSSAEGFSQEIYEFVGSLVSGVGLVFKTEYYTPLKPDGTFDSDRYSEITAQEELEKLLEREKGISFGILRKDKDENYIGLDTISIKIIKEQ